MKMKKRFRKLMSVIMVCAMLICMTNGLQLNMLTAKAATYSGACGPSLNWSLDTQTGVLAITGSGWMANYSPSGSPWYSYRNSISSVELSDEMTNIGSYAFENCSNLSGNLIIPGSITDIGNTAFYGCSGFVGIVVDPENTVYDSRGNCNALIEISSNGRTMLFAFFQVMVTRMSTCLRIMNIMCKNG